MTAGNTPPSQPLPLARRSGSPADASLPALIAVAALAVPVSTIAGLMDLEMDGMSLALSADGYWLAMALVAVLCSPGRFRRSQSSKEAVLPSTPSQGNA